MIAALWICALSVGGATSGDIELRSLVDSIRAEHGLAPVRPNAALQSAARSHVEYMRANREVGHQEDPGKRGFTGRTPGDRARHFGYQGANSEAVAWGSALLVGSIQSLFEAPYHRAMFLQPESPDFGATFSEGALCAKLGGRSGNGAVVSPPDGAKGVPTVWDGIESPDPLRGAGLTGQLGYPIVLALFGVEAEGLRLVFAKLSGPNGEVPALVLHPGNDEHACGAVIVVPRERLAKKARHTVRIVYSSSTGLHDVRATFTTSD